MIIPAAADGSVLRAHFSALGIGVLEFSRAWWGSVAPLRRDVEIEGLEQTRVGKIEPLTAVADQGAIDFGDLRILFLADTAQAWFSWHKSFVVDGTGDEKSATLTFFAPDMKNELGSVTLRGLGIHRLAPAPVPDEAEQIARLGAELYCERMELAVHGSREPATAAAE